MDSFYLKSPGKQIINYRHALRGRISCMAGSVCPAPSLRPGMEAIQRTYRPHAIVHAPSLNNILLFGDLQIGDATTGESNLVGVS
jgi:hypothetical protein